MSGITLRGLLVGALALGVLLFSLPASAWMDLRRVCFKAGHPVAGESLEPTMDPAPGCFKYSELTETTDILKRYPDMRVEVAGHADPAECEGQACQLLSERRAQVMADYLRQNGVDPRQIVAVVGYGISRLLVNIDRDSSEHDHRSNRRVEINVQTVELRHRRQPEAVPVK